MAAGGSSPSTFARFYNLNFPALQARILSAQQVSGGFLQVTSYPQAQVSNPSLPFWTFQVPRYLVIKCPQATALQDGFRSVLNAWLFAKSQEDEVWFKSSHGEAIYGFFLKCNQVFIRSILCVQYILYAYTAVFSTCSG